MPHEKSLPINSPRRETKAANHAAGVVALPGLKLGHYQPEWPLEKRIKWLQTAANIFDLIYKGEGGIKVEPATAQRSPRPHD
jgi:hypothetical protein